MDELLAKYMLGEATAAEIEVIDKWVFASDDNLKYFTHFKLIWEMSRELKVESSLNPEESWAEFKQLTAKSNAPVASIKPLTSYSYWMKFAAMWLVVLAFAALYFTFRVPGQAKMIVLQTFNEVKSDTLSDGSVITLNKNSRLSYPEKFSGDQRTVKLITGEAFFAVAHNPSKPFIIHINDAMVRVLGTSFNIKNSKYHAEIIVETGIVQVIRKKVTVRLKRREKADIDFSRNKLNKSSNPDDLYKYYRTQQFVADKTPLWRIVQVLNEIYHVNIQIADKKLAKRTITTTFKVKSLDSTLNIIADTFNVQVIHQTNKIIIK